MEIIEIVKGLISSEFNIPLECIHDTSTFEDLGMDSLDTLEHTLDLELEFGIDIPDEYADNVNSVQSSVDCVHKVMSEQMNNEEQAFLAHNLSKAILSEMSLRDYFAAQVISEVYKVAIEEAAHGSGLFSHEDWRYGLALDAYMLADAMMKARENK